MSIQRRKLLVGTGGVLLAAGLAGRAGAAGQSHHGGGGSQRALFDAASACRDAGDLCLAHCLARFAEGDTTLAGCARAVQEMLAVDEAVAGLAALGSTHTRTLDAAVTAVFRDCEAECRKHEGHHEECRVCADACVAVRKALEAVG